MPLPTDEKLLALSQEILQQFDTIFGLHPGFRPAHAKGAMLTGTFTPSAEAASLTRAAHMTSGCRLGTESHVSAREAKYQPPRS